MFLITGPVAKECVAHKIASQNIPGQTNHHFPKAAVPGQARGHVQADATCAAGYLDPGQSVQFKVEIRKFQNIVFSFSSNPGWGVIAHIARSFIQC